MLASSDGFLKQAATMILMSQKKPMKIHRMSICNKKYTRRSTIVMVSIRCGERRLEHGVSWWQSEKAGDGLIPGQSNTTGWSGGGYVEAWGLP